MIQRYPVLKDKKLRIDHLTTYSKYTPTYDYRDEFLKVPEDQVNHKDIGKACPPNVIHASDACQLAFTICGYEAYDNLDQLDEFTGDFALVHDAFGAHATAELDELIQRARDGYVRCTVYPYLQGILEANGIDPLDLPVPDFKTFDPRVSKDAGYMIC